MKKNLLITGIVGLLISNFVMAQGNLPFIGKKAFNFQGGSGTGYSISIEKNGNTVIKFYPTGGTSISYKGKFSNPIILKDGTGWLFKNNKIYSLV